MNAEIPTAVVRAWETHTRFVTGWQRLQDTTRDRGRKLRMCSVGHCH
ncbi:hypothetical protein E3A20_26930 [Planctomyces bekefii]|uniref:Uncharacterized protein n=1 Tax=Planctomyces bekefii TaxID=1653850 RepID=A0A5C6M1M6_9PLAN|nr:hypothetical protein E3A20_26930 [Planctomyces bekefii]